MKAAADTLYSDPYDEMSDYLDVLMDMDADGGISMAAGLVETEPGESGQRPPGIWCLFGLEIFLSAAGVPSASEECRMMAEWAKGMNLQATPEVVAGLKAALAKVIAWRAENAESTDDPLGLEHEAGENMMRRIEAMPVGNGTYHERDGWIEPNPISTEAAQVTKSPGPPAGDLEPPPWWPDLLKRCRAVVSAHPDVISRLRQADAEGWTVYSHHIRLWSPEQVALPMDPSATEWLVGEVARHDGEGTCLLQWFLTPSVYTSEYVAAVSFWATVEAYRTMLAALSVIGPKGLAEFLPHGANEWTELINLRGSSIFGRDARRYSYHLFSTWSGVYPEGRNAIPGTHPVEFWREMRGIWESGKVITSRFLLEDLVFVQAHWGAWLCGEWSTKSFLKLLAEGACHTNGLPELGSRYRCTDDRFPQFTADYNASACRLLIRLIQNRASDESITRLRYYRGPIDMELFMAIAERVAQGEPLDTFGNLVRVNVLPTPEELPAVQERLAALPQDLLKRLLTKAGLALPSILDALADRQFAETAKVILGTFSEPLMPDAHDFYRYGPHESTKFFHPGRAACGTTDFNPFLAAVAACPSQTFDEICRIFDGDGLVEVAYCSRPLKQIAGLPLGKIKRPDSLIPDEDTSIIHRLPAEPMARAEEVRARADGLARWFLPRTANRDTFYSFGKHHLRSLSYLHAEAAGFASWKTAVFDLARHLRETSELVLGECRFRQTPAVFPGYEVIKGKRSLKNVPPAIAKSAEFAPFLGRCQLLYGIACLLRLTVIEEWVNTGEFPDGGFCGEFKSIFGVDPRDWIRERDQPDPSATLRPAIVELAGLEKGFDFYTPLHYALIFSDSPIIPREFLPRLRECGWTYDPDRGGDYRIVRGLRGVGTFLFRLVTSEGERAQTKGGLPKTPHYLMLEQIIQAGGNRGATIDERLARAISVIMHDIAITYRTDS
jgi:hypothetical protein